MSNLITWQQDSINPDNPHNLSLIKQWWEQLNAKEILWQQRLIASSGNLEETDWENQHFDEKFALQLPRIGGITLYWQKSDSDVERSITVRQLVLDTARQRLYIYPQSQPQLVIRVSKPEVKYQNIEIKDPLIVGTSVGENTVFLLRDKQQLIEIKLTLSPKSLSLLLESLNSLGFSLPKYSE